MQGRTRGRKGERKKYLINIYNHIYIYCIYLSLLHFMFASISLQLFKAYLDFIMFSICGRIPFGTSLPSTNPLVFCEKT